MNRETHRMEDQSNRCTMCHGSLMPVAASPNSPVVSFGSKSSKNVLSWFNNGVAPRFAALRLPNYPAHRAPLPAMGEVNPAQRDAVLKRCIPRSGKVIAPGRVSAIREAMNCASCHDGEKVTRVHPLMVPDLFEGTPTVEAFVHSGVMPPGNGLTRDEREALHYCLVSEYYGGLTEDDLHGDSAPGTFIRALSSVPCPITRAISKPGEDDRTQAQPASGKAGN